jgi:hypothetical protein
MDKLQNTAVDTGEQASDNAPEISALDQAAAQYEAELGMDDGQGAAPAVEPQQPAQDQPPEMFEITHNGQVVQVPITEKENLAQMGYAFTQKTQALADERRSYEQLTKVFNDQPLLLDAVKRAMSGLPAFPADIQQQYQQGQQASQAPPVNLDDYTPEVAALFKTVDELKQQNQKYEAFIGGLQQQQVLGQVNNNVAELRNFHKQQTGQDITPDEETMLAGFFQENGFDPTKPAHMIAAHNMLFRDKLISRAQQNVAERAATDRRNGVVSRIPAASGRPAPNATPINYKEFNSDTLAAYLEKNYG